LPIRSPAEAVGAAATGNVCVDVLAAAILPVKRFEAAKQRLAESLGAGARVALAAAMFSDVLGALERAEALEPLVVVSGDRQVRDVVAGHEVVLIGDVNDKGQSHAARSGLARAAALGCRRAALVPSDCPLLEPSELDGLVAASADADVVIVPDRHGTGTNALVLDPSGPFEPQFGPDSLRRHVEQAKRRGLTHSVERPPSLLLDVDTGDDLVELAVALERSHGRAPRTQGVLRQIERTRGSRSVAA
jgi:2-phospho-L-lactate/phosphoenolpyruvate guanylyltransferase